MTQTTEPLPSPGNIDVIAWVDDLGKIRFCPVEFAPMMTTQTEIQGALDEMPSVFEINQNEYDAAEWLKHNCETIRHCLKAMADPEWKLVPKEANLDMAKRGRIASESHGYFSCWRSMLSAAPAYEVK